MFIRMAKINRTALLFAALVISAVCAAGAAALIGLALLTARGVRALLADRLTTEGNRLYRLSQRLADALDRLDAAIRICVRG